MKLAYITSMATGGLAGFNYREIMEMRRLGVDLFLFITKFKNGPYMPPNDIPVHSAKPVKTMLSQPKQFLLTPFSYLKLLNEAVRTKTLVDFFIAQDWAEKINKYGATWIHCHWGDHKLYIGYYCHKLTNLPLSVTIHGYDLYANPNWEMFERSIKSCAQIITISEYNRRFLIEKFGNECKRVKVIRLSADLFTDPDEEKNIKRVLIVGGFHQRKGYDTLLEALHLLNRKDIHLWVVGYKGPVNVRKLVTDYQLEDRVTIFGQVSDDVIKVLYKLCDIFCLPSRFGPDGVGEGLPVSLMEGMSYGKPIVSTYHTAIPELVPDILVKENDSQGLANAIAKLADDQEMRHKMGKRNREIIKRDYSNDNVKTLLESFTLKH